MENLPVFLGQGYGLRVLESGMALLVYLLLRAGLTRLSRKNVSNAEKRYRLIKIGLYLLNSVLILALFQIWSTENWSLASFVGLLSAGLAFILREPLLNIAGWVFIVTRQPFTLGDRVEVNGQAGDVVNIGLNDFTVMEIGEWVEADQSTGRIVHLPNSWVFTQSIANYNKGFPFLWHELKAVVTYESDWAKAREILRTIAEEQGQMDRVEREKVLEELSRQDNYLIYFKHLTPIVYLTKTEDGIGLVLRYLCQPRRRRSTEDSLWEEIFTRFAAEDDISFAYQTHRWVVRPKTPDLN